MTEGKTGSQKRSLRRHHDQRKKAWVRKNLTHYFYDLAVLPADRVGRYAKTPKVCSCFMCGNPRHYHGGPTLQERRALPIEYQAWKEKRVDRFDIFESLKTFSLVKYPGRVPAFGGLPTGRSGGQKSRPGRGLFGGPWRLSGHRRNPGCRTDRGPRLPE